MTKSINPKIDDASSPMKGLGAKADEKVGEVARKVSQAAASAQEKVKTMTGKGEHRRAELAGKADDKRKAQ
jgi:hypothetical protein